MADCLRGGESKWHDAAEQVLLAFYAERPGRIGSNQRVVRYEIQRPWVMARTVEWAGEIVALDCCDDACDFAVRHVLVVPAGTTRIGNHGASRLRLLRHGDLSVPLSSRKKH